MSQILSEMTHGKYDTIGLDDLFLQQRFHSLMLCLFLRFYVRAFPLHISGSGQKDDFVNFPGQEPNMIIPERDTNQMAEYLRDLRPLEAEIVSSFASSCCCLRSFFSLRSFWNQWHTPPSPPRNINSRNNSSAMTFITIPEIGWSR